MAESIRLQCLKALQAAFLAVEKGLPADDPFQFGFSIAEIGPLSGFDNRKRTSIGIVANTDTPSDTFPNITERQFTVDIEWQITRNAGDPAPGILCEMMNTEVQRVVYSARDLGGLCIDIKELSTTVDMDTYADKGVAGLFKALITYRHSLNDPRSIDPSSF